MKAATCDWAAILRDAVTRPGIISTAYTRFWNYSVGNQLLALWQCALRGIEPGPIHTFKGWLRLGRCVRKGEKAITLVRPIVARGKRNDPTPGDRGEAELTTEPAHDNRIGALRRTIFVERPFWFVLSQTDGEPYTPPSIPQWDQRLALHTLGIDLVPFRHTNGNVQGYAEGRSVAVSPIAHLPHRTLFHELAHVCLGHTAEVIGLTDDHERTPKDLREAEAECVALLCCESLGMEGAVFSRAYIQHWYQADEIPPRSVHRIFKAADTMLRAGRPASIEGEADTPAA